MKIFAAIAWKKQCKRLFLLALLATLGGWATLRLLHVCFPFPRQLLRLPKASQSLADRSGEHMMSFVNEEDAWYFPVTTNEVSDHFIKALISVEDKNFYRHHGIDYAAIVRALWGNVSGTRPMSGASTITMQTMRLLQPRPRTLWHKCVEAFRAWQLEKLLGKDEILTIYMNRTPYGSNLIGVEAAARRYFGKGAKHLSMVQACLLAGLPQSPERLRPDRNFEKSWRRCVFVMSRLSQEGHITRDELLQAIEEQPEIAPAARPFVAPHFCYWLRGNAIAALAPRTTLDLQVQRLAENALAEGLQQWVGKGIDNGAVVVIDNRQDAVRAMVGSADFFASTTQGQINGALQPRSPGSALKPFTYAMAFDDGLVTPASVILDLPYLDSSRNFQNYDKTYHGPVNVRNALSSSLNIPPLRLLEKVGVDRLLGKLRQAGVRSLSQPAAHYGLTLTLGGCEVTLLDLAEAYATLARHGIYRPLRCYESQPTGTSVGLFSQASAYLVSDILRDTRQLAAASIPLPQVCPPFAWKTGTSSHHRDAWACVYNPDITVAVWIGNVDARKVPEIVGLHAAAPIACRIFVELARGSGTSWYAQPDTVRQRQVCAVSGRPPRVGICPHAVSDLYIADLSPELPCDIHVESEIDVASGYTVCADCRNGRPSERRVCEVWEAQAALWWREHGGEHLQPRHDPACPRAREEDFVIVSPLDGREYASASAADAELYIWLQAASNSPGKLYWLADGVLLESVEAGGKVRYRLQPGKHTIVCVDEQGRQRTVTISVR